MVKNVNTNEFDEARNADVAVVDFYADWCGPCKMVGPVVEEISNEITGVNFYKVNVDNNHDLATEFGIMSIPAIFVFKKGVKVAEQIGFAPKDALLAMINAAK